MISAAAAFGFDKRHCRPLKRSHTSIGGPTIPLRQPRTNRGQRWTWPGIPPHGTRMHAYASLTSTQKAGWRALAATLSNGHSTTTPAPYSGPIAYMIVNLYRRLEGLPYPDDPPPGDAPSSALTGQIEVAASTPRQFVSALPR